MNLALPEKPVANVSGSALRRWVKAFRVAFFKPQERRTEQLNIRSTTTVVRKLTVLAKVWTIASRAATGDEELEVSMNDTAFRLLESTVDAALGEILGKDSKLPESEQDWKRVEAEIRRQLSK